jgi:hypothetical protein
MSRKISINLAKPVAASNDCLPHAAMNLGSARGSGMRPMPGMVSRLVIQEQAGQWILYRMDADGGFVGDTWHSTQEDAIRQANQEFHVEIPGSEEQRI